MKSPVKYQHLASVVSNKRTQLLPGSLRAFYEKFEGIPLDYQTWNHIETGRRLPKPEKAIQIADYLEIDYKDIIVAYMRDLFAETKVQAALDPVGQSFSSEDFMVICEAREIDRGDVQANAEQIGFISENPRSMAVLSYGYIDGVATLNDIAYTLGLDLPKTTALLEGLDRVGLIDFQKDKERVHQLFSGIRINKGATNLHTRKKIFTNSINDFVSQDSLISSIVLQLTEESAAELRSRIQFLDAMAIKMSEQDRNNPNSELYHVLASFSPYKASRS